MTDLSLSPDDDARLRALLADTLGLAPGAVAALSADSGLFGTMPALDSLGVAQLLGAIEEAFDLRFDDDAIDLAMLETYGGLARGVAAALPRR